MAQLEILNQEQIDFLIDNSDYSVKEKPPCIVKDIHSRYKRGYKDHCYTIVKHISFYEAQSICRELNRLWMLKPFVSSIDSIISWIELNRSLTITVKLYFK